MKKIALIGSTGPVFGNVLTALLEKGYSVLALVTDPDKVMVNNDRLTIHFLDTSSKEAISKELAGVETAVIAYETDFLDVNNNDFILHTYAETVNAVIEAGVKRLIVVGNKDSEAFLRGELNRRKDLIESDFRSTEGDYYHDVADMIG